MSSGKKSFGFTLIEMIVSMTIMGIVAAMVAVFIRSPVDAYFDTVRRAELSEEADLALRRIVNDLHSALPNSYVETASSVAMLHMQTGGRYRSAPDNAGSGTPLVAGVTGTSFSHLGRSNGVATMDALGRAISSGRVCMGNVSYLTACHSTADTWASNCVSGAAVSGSTVSKSSTSFPQECFLQDSARFSIVDEDPVEYALAGGTGLVRTAGGVDTVIARNATDFQVRSEISASNTLVQTFSLRLTVESEGEKIVMMRQARVLNLP